MRWILKALAGTVLAGAAAILCARVLFPLPEQQGRTDSKVSPPSTTGLLGEAAGRLSADHTGLTGVMPLHG